mgnify:CR=1 FL=1
MRRNVIFLLVSVSLWQNGISLARSQPIVAAPDGTGSVVSPSGNQFEISGGTQQGGNLFHSLERFNLEANQRANFLTNPTVQNILGRITGGEPSLINGVIQVSGSQANLFLMNPAGLVFGNGASLNVPGAFTATTANAIALDNQWFQATGPNVFSQLGGTPTGFAFLTGQPGAILNSGHLAVEPGRSLTLLGGTVINTGTLTAPDGQVTIAAVPGEQWVQIRAAGSVLNLELPLELRRSLTTSLPIAGKSLPELLTGGQLAPATGVSVQNGVVTLTSTGTALPTQPGTAIASGSISVASPPGPRATLAALAEPTIHILGHTVGVLNAQVDASGVQGGTIRVGGDYQGQGDVPRAHTTVIDRQTTLRADGTAGAGGTVIVWADDTTRFHGQISATGSRGHRGGFVETSGKANLDITLGTVVANAPQGDPGVWLLDPSDITIATGGTGTLSGGLFDPLTPVGPIDPTTIATALDNGTNVILTTASGTGGNGDISLLNSINQNGGGTASLTLNSRRFNQVGGATINLSSTGGLTFNLNTIAPEPIAPFASIQAAQDAIGTVAGPRTIRLAPGTYQGNTPITFTRSLTLQGAGPDTTILTNTNGTEGIQVAGGTGATIEINGVTLANNSATALRNDGTLILSNSVLRNNAAAQGGAIANGSSGNLTVLNSQIRSNQSGTIGGGIFNEGQLAIANSQIANNQAQSDGGGIYNTSNGTVSLRTTTLQRNTANDGGGIYTNGNLAIADSAIVNNQANGGNGGGIFNRGTATITTTTLDANQANDSGGAIFNGGELNLSRSTLSHNIANSNSGTAGNGGGLYNQATATLTNTTISGNLSLQGRGGGIFDTGTLSLNSTTIAQNMAAFEGGGVYTNTTVGIRNTIVGGNMAPNGPDVAGNFQATGPNLIGIQDGSTGFQPSLLVGTRTHPVNPQLGPLADNGGPTKTHDLLPTSPAINAGDDQMAPSVDQRGFTRIANSGMDLGAIETSYPTPRLPPPQAQGLPLLPSPLPLPLVELGAILPLFDSPRSRLPERSRLDETPILISRVEGTTEDWLVNTDQSFSRAYEQHLNLPRVQGLNLAQLQATLQQAKTLNGANTGIIYAVFVPAAEVEASGTWLNERSPQPDDQLQLILITATGSPIRRSLPITRAQATAQAKLFRLAAADPDDNQSYISLGQQFYQWLLQPLKADLEAQAITSLIYCLDEGLRTIPLAAMLDRQTFVIEQYDLALIPSVALSNLRVAPLKRDRLLAMGASAFTTKNPLPAVPVELKVISQHIPTSQVFLNEQFTIANLQTTQAQSQPDILHLATHAEFNPGNAQQSYIQLWDTKLDLPRVRSLNWQRQDLSLLILSACTTAVSSREAELGFAGLAAIAGVRSALGTLWTVSDVGTLALMGEFYAQLKTAPTVASALRQAQLALLQQTVQIRQGQLQSGSTAIPLPGLTLPQQATLAHPFYWSPFVVVGNPW